jgi:glc operon protein GlcG
MKMRDGLKAFCLAILVATAATGAARAAGDDLVVYVPEISSLAAQRLVEACIAIADQTDAPIAVAVVNPAGELLHFHARQGASPTAPITAQMKAVTSARWRRSTSQLEEEMAQGGNRGPEYIGDYPAGAGGLPLIMGEHTIGAIGAAGPGGPEECAAAAVRQVFGDTVSIGRE